MSDDKLSDQIGDQDERKEEEGLSARSVFWNGMKGAVNLPKALLYIVRLQTSSSISVQQCFVLNGTLFLGSIVLFNVVLMPLLDRMAEDLAWLDSTQARDRKEQWELVQEIVRDLSSYMFQVFWLVPMYVISIVLNAVFNVDIAKQVYTVEFGEPVKSLDSIVDLIRDSMYNYGLMCWVSLFCWGIYFLRFVGPIISLVWTSWAIAFYAFDLAWTLRGWDLQKRLVMFQKHWIFMLGFGTPTALVTFFLPQFLGYGVYALALPVSIILAIISTPSHHQQSALFPRTVRMFLFAEYVNLLFLKFFGMGRRAPQRQHSGKNSPR